MIGCTFHGRFQQIAMMDPSAGEIIASTTMGEFGNFHPEAVSRGAWLSLLYLIVAGSIIEFTAYV